MRFVRYGKGCAAGEHLAFVFGRCSPFAEGQKGKTGAQDKETRCSYLATASGQSATGHAK